MFGVYEGLAPSPKKLSEMTQSEQANEGTLMMIKAMQSCPGKAIILGVSGFALGGFFGLFMASMAYDIPVGMRAENPMDKIPLKQQIKTQFTDMAKRSYSSAKNFGFIGMVYSSLECVIESLRAKHDIYNSVSAGCVTGGSLSYKLGPKSAALSCLGFAAFSSAVDLYLGRSSNPPPENDYDE